jgi:Fe-S cluster assembly iron-binding protein IscA
MNMEKTENITITPEAAIAIKTLLDEQNLPGHYLRVFIAGVG